MNKTYNLKNDKLKYEKNSLSEKIIGLCSVNILNDRQSSKGLPKSTEKLSLRTKTSQKTKGGASKPIKDEKETTPVGENIGGKTHACSYCGKKSYKKENLKSHIRIHTGEKPFACPICAKTFRQSSQLMNHEKTHKRGK